MTNKEIKKSLLEGQKLFIFFLFIYLCLLWLEDFNQLTYLP